MPKNLLCDAPGTLVKATLKLVEEESRGLLAVHTRTGVPLYWLRKFQAGKINKPNANRIQFLFERLSQITLKTK